MPCRLPFTSRQRGWAPHSSDYKAGWSDGWYGNNDWDDNQWGDKKKSHKYKKDAWGARAEEWLVHLGLRERAREMRRREGMGGGKDWGKDPHCDPPMTRTPEPSTLLLLGSSLAAAGVAWRRRRQTRQLPLEPSV